MIKTFVIYLLLLTADRELNQNNIEGRLEIEVDEQSCIERICLQTSGRKCYETPKKGALIRVIDHILLIKVNEFDRCAGGQLFLWYNRSFATPTGDYGQSIMYVDRLDGEWKVKDSWGNHAYKLNFKARTKLGVPIGIEKIEYY